ncbi:MAG: UbiH/UbiF family hydroxylase [Phyllobacteriaceae bacterium]|jgi:2-octaprenyl-6-methoxyphenol hydroxylase|nr:UbiH/UbiF family hydroxylase [Phyllobacteriaceae bacterium]
MSHTLDARVIVVGGGPAGLAAAALLAFEGVPTMLIAPEAGPDPRTVALMDPALRLLSRLGVWPGQLAELSSPLLHLDIIDEMGRVVSAPRLTFSASEMGLEAFGWNIPLGDLILALRGAVEQSGVQVIDGTVLRTEDLGAVVAVDTGAGQRYYAEVLVAADGAESILRTSAGIGVDRWSYDQSALVTTFSHSGPHYGVSCERHRSGGPFTTVPLPGNASSLVWMAQPPVVESLLFRTAQELAMEIQLLTHGSLGLISHVSPPKVFPMRGLRARRFAGNRTLLTGETAHAFPPIGAQGLNMSLRDVGHAVDVVLGHDDAGSLAACDDYHYRRNRDVTERQAMISAMNTSLIAEFLPLDLMRVGALSLISAFPPLRGLVMRQGLAPENNLPYVMR